MFTMTAREFNQRIGRAQRIADDEPVLVTRHGVPAYVLLNIDAYERLQGREGSDDRSFLERLAVPERAAGDDEFGRVMDEIAAERARDLGRRDVEF